MLLEISHTNYFDTAAQVVNIMTFHAGKAKVLRLPKYNSTTQRWEATVELNE